MGLVLCPKPLSRFTGASPHPLHEALHTPSFGGFGLRYLLFRPSYHLPFSKNAGDGIGHITEGPAIRRGFFYNQLDKGNRRGRPVSQPPTDLNQDTNGTMR